MRCPQDVAPPAPALCLWEPADVEGEADGSDGVSHEDVGGLALKKQENVTLKGFFGKCKCTVRYYTTLRRCFFMLNIVNRECGGIINYSFHYIIPQNNNKNNSNNSLPHPDRRLVLIVRPANALRVPDVGPVEEGHGGPGGEQEDGVQADHSLGVEPAWKTREHFLQK